MLVSIHQPAYLPWLGYFEKIINSDLFIYLDNVQFEKNSFINRNKIKTPQGEIWLTVPVKMKGHISNTIDKILVDNTQKWQKTHLNSIIMNYKKAEFFEELYSKIEIFYKNEYSFLSDYCYEYLLFWLKELSCDTKIIKASAIDINSKKSDLVLDLCKKNNAHTYISGAMGKDYLDEREFLEENINIVYQDYKHPLYTQLWGDFLPYMSILDFCMNTKDYNLIIKNKEII